jgi:hypothetical protein
VTPEGMEAEIISLREQVLQLQQQQEGQKKQWLWWSRIGAGFAIALLAADAYSRSGMPMPPNYGGPPLIFFVMLFLTLAFGSVARPTKIGMKAHLRNFALWVIIVLLLLVLFTLFQFRA